MSLSKRFKPVLSFDVHPLPVLVARIRKHFVGKFVVVKYGSYESYCFGTLTDILACKDTVILVLENDGKKLVILNPSIMRVV